MIVCPRCQFENPEHHRYCQACGAMLVQGMAVDPQSEHNDGFVRQDSAPFRAEKDIEEGRSPQDNMVHLKSDQESSAVLLAICAQPPAWLTDSSSPEVSVQYLDRANRYQLVVPLSESTLSESALSDLALANAQAGLEILVIDSQPDASPYLEQNQNPAAPSPASIPGQPEAQPETQTGAQPETTVTVTMPHLAIPLLGRNTPSPGKRSETSLNNCSSLPSVPLGATTDNAPSIDVPLIGETPQEASPVPVVWTLAAPTPPDTTPDIKTIQTYFDLQDLLYPSFPRLIDAWNDGGAVVVLENRSDLVCLKDMVLQPTVVPPQLLHWCHEMTELWEVLKSHQCCQSLLRLDNVRIDEDHILCLRRLYFDDLPEQYTLQDLGELWETLFGGCLDHMDTPTCPTSLVNVYQDLVSGAIADLDTLRFRLESAADQIHQSALGEVDSAPEGQGNLGDGMGPMGMGAGAMGPVATQNVDPEAVENVSQANEGIIPQEPMTDPMDQSHDPPSSPMGLGDDPTIVLPMQLYSLSNAGLTNIGTQRDHNEDFFAMDTQIHTTDLPSGRVCQAKGLYVLCDGMGGHAAGEVASAAAGDILQSYFQEHWSDTLPDEATLEKAIIAANQGIYEQNQADASEGSRRMGTTLVMLLVQDTKVAIAHVGDSRIYRFTRRQGLEQLTVDHEVGQREIARGVAPDVAYARPDAYQLTQALGPRDQDFIRPDIQFIEMNEDSLFILGSDGLTDNDLLETYCDSHIEPLISTNANLDEGTYQLIELANQVNGHDNITVLLVRVKLRPKLSMLHR